ncbi:MAG: hypothetical protein QXW70_02195 [Candidatus Anstonellales archaeon]
MIELSGNRTKILDIIKNNTESEEFVLKVKPSKILFSILLTKTRVKRIFVSNGILKTIPAKVLKAFPTVGVKLIKIDLKRGRKEKVNEEKLREALRLILMGKTLKEASQSIGVSSSWLCVRLRKYRRKNYARKKYLLI